MNTFENKIDMWIMKNPYVVNLIRKYESKFHEKDFSFSKENLFELYKDVLEYNNIDDDKLIAVLKILENEINIYDLTKESLFKNHIFFILNLSGVKT